MTHIVIQKWSCNRCGRSLEKESADSEWVPEGWRTLYLGELRDEMSPALVADLCPTCHQKARQFAAGVELVDGEPLPDCPDCGESLGDGAIHRECG